MELDYNTLIVSREENLAYYRKLGFKEENRVERGYDTVVFMEHNSIVLEVFIEPKHSARVTERKSSDFATLLLRWTTWLK